MQLLPLPLLCPHFLTYFFRRPKQAAAVERTDRRQRGRGRGCATAPPPRGRLIDRGRYTGPSTAGTGGVSLCCFMFVCMLPVSVLLPPSPSPARRAHPLFPKKGSAYPFALRIVCCLTFTAWRVQRWGSSLDELPQPASSLNRNKRETRRSFCLAISEPGWTS